MLDIGVWVSGAQTILVSAPAGKEMALFTGKNCIVTARRVVCNKCKCNRCELRHKGLSRFFDRSTGGWT
jgi:hypothetical protein